MATIKIPYGKVHLTADLPDERLVGVLTSSAHAQTVDGEAEALDHQQSIAPLRTQTVESQEELVREALQNPVSSQPLSELAKGKRKIVVITSDHTRPVPSKITAPLLVEEIRRTNTDAEIIFLIATGFHRASTSKELEDKFGKEFLSTIKIAMHDCQDDAAMVKIGTLPSGGDLVINRLVTEADLLVAEGFIEPHFFAGFSGGRKSVLPGVVSKVTVLANHSADFIANPNARAGVLEGNPLHIDMLYAAEQANLAFILNVVIDAEKRIIRAYAGHPVKAHERGCEYVLNMASVKALPAEIVITSNGGYPLDQNLYQAVKGMTAAEATVRPGGVIIICAACNDGHGGEDYYRWFADSPGGAAEVMEKIKQIKPQDTLPDQWEAQILARVLLKANVIVVTDQYDHQMIRNMHMQAAASLQEALAMAEKIVGTESKITVIPDGVSVIVI